MRKPRSGAHFCEPRGMQIEVNLIMSSEHSNFLLFVQIAVGLWICKVVVVPLE